MYLLSTVGKQLFTPRGKPSSLDIESLWAFNFFILSTGISHW